MPASLGLHPFFELASLASLLALSMRNQLWLRFVLLLAYALQVVDAYASVSNPVWDHIGWNLIFFGFNLYVLCTLVYGRTTFWLTEAEKELLGLFVTMTPGAFRKLAHAATWKTAEAETSLTTEGVVPDKLFFVYAGSLTITKAARHVTIEPLTFIGEVAFIRGTPASASVTVAPGTRWVEWSAPKLRRLLAKDVTLRTEFNRMLGDDLAQKVARA